MPGFMIDSKRVNVETLVYSNTNYADPVSRKNERKVCSNS